MVLLERQWWQKISTEADDIKLLFDIWVASTVVGIVWITYHPSPNWGLLCINTLIPNISFCITRIITGMVTKSIMMRFMNEWK
jgi:hypothetical protein